jgi:hypothetical protein
MATFTTTTAIGQKEDLASFISMITRDETPFMSSIGTSKASNVYHEWQTDELAAPAANAAAEGSDYSNASTIAPTTRLGNYAQIATKEIKISKTLDTVSKAGRASEFAYQMKKRGTELKRDLEHSCVGARQGQVASGTREFGGVQSWVNEANVVDMADGAIQTTAGGGGDGTDPIALGTATALTLSAVDLLMQTIYEAGGKATTLMMSPSLKRTFSGLAVGTTGVRRDIGDDGKLRASVEIYESDFGAVKVVPNYIQGLGAGKADLIAYDPSWWSMAVLRPLHNADVGQKGDSTVGLLVEETTLQCKNPKGNGMVTNCIG